MIAYPMQVAGVLTRVLEAGKSGPVVVLVHGTCGRADRWSRNLDALATAGYHAYAFDLPGHGFAAKGPGVDCSVPGYRKFLSLFLEKISEEKKEKTFLVGTSLGGHVVASYAVENPARVAAVALVGSMALLPIGA